MKTIKWILKTTSFLLLISLVMISCKKKKTAPTLTLNGATQITLCLGETYTEAGASALDAYGDNVDVVISGDVNTSLVGTYTIEYTATDKNNNETSALTTVTVGMCTSSLVGSYDVVHDCSALSQDLINSEQSITVVNEDQIKIENFNTVVSEVTATVDGNQITIPEESFSFSGVGNASISGTGTIDDTGSPIEITYTYSITDAFIGIELAAGSCTATYTKQ